LWHSIDSQTVDNKIPEFRIYEKADKVYDLDEYIELKDMREVIIELLPNVKIFRDNDQTQIKIFYHQNLDIIPDPLFLVNGNIVKDNDFILNMDNRNIKRIEILFNKSTLEPFGPLGIGGVVAIYTKKPVSIPSGLQVDLEGYHKPAEKIIQFDPGEMPSDHYPEFNPLLYWDPVCKTNDSGVREISFHTNDLVSDFEIVIEGLTPDGRAFYHCEIVSVKKPY
jgi:hypothetical protein